MPVVASGTGMVTAAFCGLAMFTAMFVVASTLGLSIQQREREIALLRAVAATPGQIRRMIACEAAFVALADSAAGIWPGIVLGRSLVDGLMRHGSVPPNFALTYHWLPAAALIGGVATALLAVLAAGRRACAASELCTGHVTCDLAAAGDLRQDPGSRLFVSCT